MKRFRFPLERVLELRRREEEGRARELAAARQAEVAARAAAEAAQQRLVQARTRLALVPGGEAAGTLANLRLAVEAAARRADAEREAAAQAVQAEERCQAAFAEARQARAALARLREARRADWQRQVDKDEQAWLDEVALRMATDPGGRHA